MAIALAILISPTLLFVLIPLLAYGYIFFLALRIGIAAIAFFGLDRLLRLSSSNTTMQDQRRWRAAILGSMAGIVIYGFMLGMLVEWAHLPPDVGTPTRYPDRFFHEALDLFFAFCIDLFLVMAVVVGFGHGFIVGWGSLTQHPNFLPPPLPTAPSTRLTPRLRQLVFTVFWTAPTAAFYGLSLASLVSILWDFVPHQRPNFSFRGYWEVQQSAPQIGAATVLLSIIATLLWRVWRFGLLPFDIIHSARVTRHTARFTNTLARLCGVRNA